MEMVLIQTIQFVNGQLETLDWLSRSQLFGFGKRIFILVGMVLNFHLFFIFIFIQEFEQQKAETLTAQDNRHHFIYSLTRKLSS